MEVQEMSSISGSVDPEILIKPEIVEVQEIPSEPKPDENSNNKRCQYLPLMREVAAEFVGTFILLTCGLGSIAQFMLSEGKTGTADQIRWAWGFGVTFGVYVAGGISAGHLNPAVSLAFCIFNKLPWRKLVPYFIGQYMGAFFASSVVFFAYYDAFSTFKGGNKTLETAEVFATYPRNYLSPWNGLFDQILGTFLLVFLVMAVTDESNMAPPKGLIPVVLGFVVTTVVMTYSHNCDAAINPARDFSPRLFTLVAGWGTQVFSVNDYNWFWIPIVGPHTGGILAVWSYLQLQQKAWPSSLLRRHCVPEPTVEEGKSDKTEKAQVENGGQGK